jgi:hypothetical protein
VGIDRVVFGLATMHGLHIQGMAEDKRHPFLSAQVSKPVPSEHTLDGDDIVPIRGNGPEQRVWTGFHILMHENVASLVQDADVHRPGVEINPTIRLMLVGVKSHEVSSS